MWPSRATAIARVAEAKIIAHSRTSGLLLNFPRRQRTTRLERPPPHRAATGGNEIEALTIPSAREPVRQSELPRGLRDVLIASARERHGLHRAKELRNVTEVKRRPDDRLSIRAISIDDGRGFVHWTLQAPRIVMPTKMVERGRRHVDR
jgi:hypothetical protein